MVANLNKNSLFIPKTANFGTVSNNVIRFRGTAQTVPIDTVEISTKPQKKKRGIGKKILIGVGATVGALILSALLIAKHKTVKLEKLYKEKLVPQIFEKELTFTEATTKDEALKYAKEVLHVQKIDENMTLDALNYANKGITDVVNKNIGKEVFVPRSYLLYEDEHSLAKVVQTIEAENFGELGINKHCFDDKFLTEKLEKRYNIRRTDNVVTNATDEATGGLYTVNRLDESVHELYDRFITNPDSISTKEKRILYYSYNAQNINSAIHKCDWVNFAEDINKQHNINIDIEKLKTLSKKEQREYINKVLEKNKILKNFDIIHPYDDGSTTIYHELGHLQDFAKNLKELDLKKWKLPSFKKSWEEAGEAIEKGKKPEVSGSIDEIENRWSGRTYGNMQKLLDEKPDKFKNLYPDLYEFLTNKEIQTTAGKISGYAQSGIGEFIADTYAKMIKGDPIPEDVLTLYKKYNGPLPNGFV